jgi:hypothetical protein
LRVSITLYKIIGFQSQQAPATTACHGSPFSGDAVSPTPARAVTMRSWFARQFDDADFHAYKQRNPAEGE